MTRLFVTPILFLLLGGVGGGQEEKVELAVKVDTLAVDQFDGSIDLAAVDSLRLPAEMTLGGLIRRLEEQLAGIDRPLLIERRVSLMENYYRYRDGRRELVLLDSVRINLKRIYLLNQQLSGRGEISDVQVLSAHNSYLRSELEYLATERAIRDAILAVVRLANLDLNINPEQKRDGRIPEKAAVPSSE